MPGQKTTSSLAGKLDRFSQYVQEHAGDETTSMGYQGVPPGINNGVARLTVCEFKESAKKNNRADGKTGVDCMFFKVMGTVIDPISQPWNGREYQARGTQFMITEDVYDTVTKAGKVTTTKEHISNVLNIMRLLGVETKGLIGNPQAGSHLEAICQALTQTRPYFRFSTQAKKDQTTGKETDENPWQRLHGIAEDYEETDMASAAIEDATEVVAEPSGNGAATAEPFNEFEATAASEENPEIFAQGLQTLVDAANALDGSATDEILALAKDLGILSQVEATKTWEDAQGLILKAKAGEGNWANNTVEKAEAEPWIITKGDVCFYRPIDSKSKKPVKTAAECEVTAYNAKTQTVDLKLLANPKVVYKGVKSTELSR